MSSIHRFQSTWRATTFNAHLDNSGNADNPNLFSRVALAAGPVYLEAVDINRVSVQDYRELRQFLEGSEPNEAFEGVRAINGQGRIVGTSYADLEDKAWALNEQFSVSACRIAAATLTPKGVLPYDFRRASVAGTKLLRFYARPGPGRPVWIGRTAAGLVRPFTFQLIAFDPFAYDQVATNTNVALGGGNVVNPGNIQTRPIIVISFSGAGNAAFTMAIAGRTALGLNLATMANLQTLTIDVARSTIVRDDGSDQMSRRNSGFISDQYLLAGTSAIAFANTTGISQVQFQVRGAYA